MVDLLNSKYEDILKNKLTIVAAYSEMVAQHRYRVLSSYSYDDEEKPLRSERVAAMPPMTDTASDSSSDGPKIALPPALRNISAVPEHDEYVQMVINASTVAQVEGKDAKITWRGYTTTISQHFEMTRDNLRMELLSALQNLIKLNDIERKV